MYNILKDKKITEMLNNLPRKREHITMRKFLKCVKELVKVVHFVKGFLINLIMQMKLLNYITI